MSRLPDSKRLAAAAVRKASREEPATGKRPGGRGRAALGYTKPRTYEELRAVLSSGTIHFPKRLRQVAIFLWQHPGDVAVGTIAQVAAQANVQPSTLVRFAQIFGYSGFSDLQAIFKEHVKGSWSDDRNGRDSDVAEHGNPDLHFMKGLVAASQASLARVGEGLDEAGFTRMIDVLASADLVYVIGSKRAFPVTAYVSLTLSQQGIRNVLVDNVGSTAFDQVSCVSAGDAVLAVSFSPYNSITPDLVAVARERKAGIVSITDSTFSPLAELSDHWVEVVESNFGGFRSLAASLAVGMALVHGVVSRRSGQHA